VIGQIHTISGEIASRGESNSVRKVYAWRMWSKEVYSLQKPPKIIKKDSMVLSFSKEDAQGVVMPHDNALVVIVTMANQMINRILVDNGSLANILYWPAFK
jgi:hypothetical protein